MIIKGKVPISYIKGGPFLKRLYEPMNSLRAFQLCYEKTIPSTSPYAETLVLLVHEEPDVPEFVDCIRIDLPGDRHFWIRSQRPRKGH